MAQAISPGEITVMLQNVEYALPSIVCFVQSSVVIESSMNGTTWSELTGANTIGLMTGARLIRCPSANAALVCKKY